MKVLGVETSCDETGVAIYQADQGLLGHTLYSQVELHARYGGVVPELASRDHVAKLLPLVEQALAQTGLGKQQLDGMAYTAGPGLAGALLVGACFARAMAWSLQIPCVAVHHMEAHLLAVMLEAQAPSYPFLALLVSGGHTQLVDVQGFGRYQLLGESLDDSVGEAFDKVAKLLGLAYPGGAALAKLAEQGDPQRFALPRPMVDRPGLDFSFSGLKTAALQLLKRTAPDDHFVADIAAGFQRAVVETLVIKTRRALQHTELKQLVVAGGVGANVALRAALQTMAESIGVTVYCPRPEFCTDNGAMVAYAGCQHLLAGQHNDLSIRIRPRWPIHQACDQPEHNHTNQ